MGHTPSFAGMASGNDEVLELYLAYGADINEKDVEGGNVLDHAFACNVFSNTLNEEYVEKLVHCGLDVSSTDQNGFSILFHALEVDSSLRTIKFLVEHGADVNCVSMFGDHALDLFDYDEGGPSKETKEIRDYLISVGAKKPEKEQS